MARPWTRHTPNPFTANISWEPRRCRGPAVKPGPCPPAPPAAAPSSFRPVPELTPRPSGSHQLFSPFLVPVQPSDPPHPPNGILSSAGFPGSRAQGLWAPSTHPSLHTSSVRQLPLRSPVPFQTDAASPPFLTQVGHRTWYIYGVCAVQMVAMVYHVPAPCL
ncbi:formin-like protein 7 [Rhinolophus ferrumequinum]|uniref:formin-like protein 7 n=1 Tax=Rhinolophus ferrumequinum TaxID=59479 RepID=UPI00140FBC78|nr:formin-like protein 7 [Rhinolophus ferrumequinum]